MRGPVAFLRDMHRRVAAIPAPGAWFYNLVPRRFLARSEKRIAREIGAKGLSGTVLDLGSGTGFLAIEVAKLAPQACVVGIDLSPEMVRIARAHARGLPNADFRVGDVAALPFADESVEFIFSTGALHHWPEPAAAFGECRRVLRPGCEAHIYDGCPEAIDANRELAREDFGRLFVPLARAVGGIHGFPAEYFGTVIRSAAESSGFSDSCEMAFANTWMRVVLRKAL